MAAPQQGNQTDNSAGMLWGVTACFAMLGMVWYVFRSQIITFYLTLKLYEVNLLSYFDPTHFATIHSNIVWAMANTSKVNFSELISIGTGVGDWLRIPFVILLFLLGIIVYLSNTTHVFKRTYKMSEFAKLEKANWPQITPIVDLDLIKTDIDKGPWAMALTPMQFCKRNKLLDEIRPQRREGMSRKDWDRIEVALKRGDANKTFALQLGALWKGTDQLPPHARALFAVFAARINSDSKDAAKMLAQLSASSRGKLNFQGVNELLKKHEKTKLVQRIVQSHAYVLTVMASMLEGAREDGVQASADFLWVKPMDRRLWYTLNTVGRQTPFAEVAGIFAHWLAEKEAGRKLLVPMVEEATNALDVALKDVIYSPDEEKLGS
jgi:intracellular multiplication protein IcmP